MSPLFEPSGFTPRRQQELTNRLATPLLKARAAPAGDESMYLELLEETLLFGKHNLELSSEALLFPRARWASPGHIEVIENVNENLAVSKLFCR